jgi:hypothetical protein
MYGHTARMALWRVLREAPELRDLRTETGETWNKVKDARCRKLANRLIAEVWHMGFAISARQPSDHAPVKAGRDPSVHKAWRDQKLHPTPKANQSDVEVQAEKPA